MPVSVVLGPIKLTSLAVNIAEKLWSQSWPMDIRLRFSKAGKRWIDRRLKVAGEKVERRCVMCGLMIRSVVQLGRGSIPAKVGFWVGLRFFSYLPTPTKLTNAISKMQLSGPKKRVFLPKIP